MKLSSKPLKMAVALIVWISTINQNYIDSEGHQDAKAALLGKEQKGKIDLSLTLFTIGTPESTQPSQ